MDRYVWCIECFFLLVLVVFSWCSWSAEQKILRVDVLLRFHLYAFVEAAALRPIDLRYAGAPIAKHVIFPPFYLFGDVVFPSIFSSYGKFFYLVTTDWRFDIISFYVRFHSVIVVLRKN